MSSIIRISYIAVLTSFIFLSTCISLPATALGATTEVIYQNDFSADPAWTTDQPENFYWDSSRGAFYAKTLNRPTYTSTSQPSRYAYVLTDLNPAISYELVYDMEIANVSGGSGVAPFGLYGARLYGFNQLNLSFAGNNQDGTFSTRFMQIDGSPGVIATEVNPGYNQDVGEYNFAGFSVGTRYTIKERYDAVLKQYHFIIREKDTDSLVLERTITAPALSVVNPELRRLGISMHPEGLNPTNMSLASRIDGYTEYLIDNVTLTQIYDQTFTGAPSVFFLPGIQSSRLATETLIGTEDQLWEPTRNQDVEQLAMTSDGVSVEDVFVTDIIDSVYGTVPVYDSFLAKLASLKSSGTISDFETYAYDWRLGTDTIVENGTQRDSGVVIPTEVLEDLSLRTNSKVTIIAHSNGGLLAKALLNRLSREGKSNLVGRVVFLATPHFGTPKAVGALLHGYDQEKFSGLLIDDETARDTMLNFPGAYGLVPTEKYFEATGGKVISFDDSNAVAPLRAAYGDAVLNEIQLAQFMKGEIDARVAPDDTYAPARANASMLDSALSLHSTTLDSWNAPSGVEVVEVVGVGLDTVKGFRYQEFTRRECALGFINCRDISYYEAVPQITQYGDATVVDASAEGYGGAKRKYFIDLLAVKNDNAANAREHFDISELQSVTTLVTSLLSSTTPTIPFVSQTKPNIASIRDMISVHSPVSIRVTDTLGRKVEKFGSGADTRFRADIPGSSYHEFGNSKYVILPSSAQYTVVLEGEAEGSYTLALERLAGENTPVLLSRLSSATVTPEMVVTFSKSSGVYSNLAIDLNGDGTVDDITTLSGEKTAGTLFGQLRATIGGFALLKQSERSWLLNNVSKAEEAGKRKGYGSTTVSRIFSQIDGRLMDYRSRGLITLLEYGSVKGIMEEIVTR